MRLRLFGLAESTDAAEPGQLSSLATPASVLKVEYENDHGAFHTRTC